MISKIIHYCWFGGKEMPELVNDCIASWHKYMPDWQYMLWNEDNFDIASAPAYVQEAYAARKFAFVSDYVRLWALEQYGGLYLDTDVEVFKSFDDLMDKYSAFAGFEGSKHLPVGTCVLASVAHGEWVSEMLAAYLDRHFFKQLDTGHQTPDTKHQTPEYDMTTNVEFMTDIMRRKGFKQDGLEQDYKDLHVLPVDYFSPRHTTGEYIKTENTYSEHKVMSSWNKRKKGWKGWILSIFPSTTKVKLIKLKRKILG